MKYLSVLSPNDLISQQILRFKLIFCPHE